MQKKQGISSFCSGDIVDLKILQSDRSRTFSFISKEKNFPKYNICVRTKQIIYTLIIYITSSENADDQISPYITKNYFWPIFPIFEVKKFFQKIWLCHAHFIWVPNIMQISGKN